MPLHCPLPLVSHPNYLHLLDPLVHSSNYLYLLDPLVSYYLLLRLKGRGEVVRIVLVDDRAQFYCGNSNDQAQKRERAWSEF